MEIFTLLENIEDILEKSKGVPFSNKVLVDKEEILEIISELRLKLPEELKQAKWIKEERQRILVEAQKEADDIVKEAENRIISMINENEITKKAYEKKAEIIETANEMSREISKGTKDNADNILIYIVTQSIQYQKVIRFETADEENFAGYPTAINLDTGVLTVELLDVDDDGELPTQQIGIENIREMAFDYFKAFLTENEID